MAQLLNIKGRKFGRLRVLRFAGFNKWHQARWLCSCSCGNETVVTSTTLGRSGRAGKGTRSCGCLKHGPSGHRLKLAGKKFGSLRVIRFAGRNKYKQSMFLCRCKCGKKKVTEGTRLLGGLVLSCGCARWPTGTKAYGYKHGGSKEFRREYNSYRAMLTRCLDEDCPGYKDYGGRGITVCERWLGEDGFPNFLEDMKRRPEGLSLDRKNVMGNYHPDNCRWADKFVQAANRRSMMTPEEIAELERLASFTDDFYSGGEAAF